MTAESRAESPSRGDLASVIWWMAIAVVLLTPLVIAPLGEDRQRLPKEIVLRAGGIVLIATFLVAALWGWITVHRRFYRDPLVVLVAVIVLWVGFTAAVSNNRVLSAFALLRVVCVAALFVAVYVLARRRSILAVGFLLLPAIPNAILVVLQEYGIWNPFQFEYQISRHEQSTGLIGNPNDVGVYLLAPALAALALALADRGRRRVLWIAATALLMAVLLINATLTAMIALAAGLVTLVTLLPRKMAIAAAVLLAIGAIGALQITTLRNRVTTAVRFLLAGDIDRVLTSRSTAFLSAAEMARTHPLTGVGPGVFRFEYYPYKLKVEKRFPRLLESSTRNLNFGEAHNDHLQVAAEIGLPGYSLMAGALIFLGSLRWRRIRPGDDDVRRRFSRTLALPLAVALATVMGAQFPLQLAAPTIAYTYLAALCAAWSRTW